VGVDWGEPVSAVVEAGQAGTGQTRDPALVTAFAGVLQRVLVEPIAVDDRIPDYPLPLAPKLRPWVEVEWQEQDLSLGHEYRAEIWQAKGSSYSLVIDLRFAWPDDPRRQDVDNQRDVVAHELAQWYLQVTGTVQASYRLEREIAFPGRESIAFETNHNGWGQCTVEGESESVLGLVDPAFGVMRDVLEFDLGEERAKDEGFTPFTAEDVKAIVEAIWRGTPEEVRNKIKPEEVDPALEPALMALEEWLTAQRHDAVDSPELKAILDGKVGIDLSGVEPYFRRVDGL